MRGEGLGGGKTPNLTRDIANERPVLPRNLFGSERAGRRGEGQRSLFLSQAALLSRSAKGLLALRRSMSSRYRAQMKSLDG